MQQSQDPDFTEGSLPASSGYFFPAEWEPHRATWLSWPHKEESWPGKIQSIYAPYARFVKEISAGERVCINVNSLQMQNDATAILRDAGVPLQQVDFYQHPTNDAWCRDHGPAFLLHRGALHKKVVVDWKYNAWGGKYPPYDQDDIVPTRVGESLGLQVFQAPVVMEGGSVEFNGEGTVLTTTSCLLNPNRNPEFSKPQLEEILNSYYGTRQVLWLEDGIEGDDTDGHIDDITRFVNCDTVITMVEPNVQDSNHTPLERNLKTLHAMRLENGKQLNVIEIPMPAPMYHEGTRLPASYANFYIANAGVIVPTFRDANDQTALDILQLAFPDRKVVGVDSTDIIWGLGSFHCLSQQEPQV